MSKDNPYSFSSLTAFLQDNFVLVFVVALFTIGGFVVGSMWTENQILKSGGAGRSAGAPAAGQPDQPAPPSQDLSKLPEVSADDYSIGDPSKAKVTIVEYSDMNCGFCQRFHPTMKSIVNEYGDQVAWVYRHLTVLNSVKQAEAAECAGKLGGSTAFFNYVDAYFENVTGTPDASNPDRLPALAQDLGLNQARFTQCLESGEMAAKVAAQSGGAQSMGITGTPGSVIVVGGEGVEMIPGALPLDDVKAMVDRYL
jgi:protein-disulfide isomerase